MSVPVISQSHVVEKFPTNELMVHNEYETMGIFLILNSNSNYFWQASADYNICDEIALLIIKT